LFSRDFTDFAWPSAESAMMAREFLYAAWSNHGGGWCGGSQIYRHSGKVWVALGLVQIPGALDSGPRGLIPRGPFFMVRSTPAHLVLIVS
jgi:hypothetical protein